MDRRRASTSKPVSPLVSSPHRSPNPEYQILSGSSFYSGYSASEIQDAIDAAICTTPIPMNIKDILFMAGSLMFINQDEANRAADHLTRKGCNFKAKISFPVWLYDQCCYILHKFEYKKASERLVM